MIRPYRPNDNEGVLRVWTQASAVAHPFLSADFLARERHSILHVYLPKAETWIREADGQVAGFISLLGHEVGALFVAPPYHRTGIGRALLLHAQARHGDLEVEVFERNLLGRTFYAKMGFVPGQEKIHAETGYTVLRLRLAAPRG